VYDGAEIHESVLTMLAIANHGAEYQCFAPDVDQHHVIDHRTGKEMDQRRNVLVESARIARGKIRDLAEYHPADFDGVVLPGGFGAAKNLSDFAVRGTDATVQAEVARALRDTHAAHKPIAALCIAPAILARLFPGAELTIGSDAATAAALEKMGAHHRTTGHGEVVVDERLRLVTTPCYMLDATISQIATGADNAVKALLRLAG